MAKGEIEQHEDDHQRHRNHLRQLLLGANHILVLSGPGDRVAGRKFHLVAHHCARLCDIGAQVDTADINKGPAVEASIFAFQHRRAIDDQHLGNLAQRHLLPSGGEQRQFAQFFDIIALLARETQIDRVALQPLDGGGDIDAADCDSDHLVDVGYIQPKAGGGKAVGTDFDVAPAGNPFRVGGGRSRHAHDDPFEIFADALDNLQVRAGNLDANRRLDAGGKHVDARLDRHHPGVGDPGKINDPVQFVDDLVDRHARPPLIFGMELDQGFDHGQGRRVGCGVGASDFSKHALHFRQRLDEPVGLLQQLPGLADGDARHGCRHIHQVAFVEFRHELRSQAVGETRQPGRVRKC